MKGPHDGAGGEDPRDLLFGRIVLEYQKRRDGGQRVDEQALLQAYPDLAVRLRTWFAAQAGGTGKIVTVPPPVQAVDRPELTSFSSRETVYPQTSNSAIRSELASSEFGRYILLRVLGEGAMGRVYLAFDTALDRHAALKIPRVEATSSAGFRARFAREARAAAALNHPRICRVYDMGEHSGIPYITMDFIDGSPLSQLLGTPPMQSLPLVLEIVATIADALAHAHSKGVVHRDLKPGNILMDSEYRPFVTDFGLAWRQNVSGETSAGTNGAFAGTPAYMAPEQIRGDDAKTGAKTGPASDIYSLGVMFFELVTGRLPFDGNLSEVLSKVLRDSPPIPSRLRDGLSEDFDDIILKMLKKEPERRYSSMAEVSTAVRKLQQRMHQSESKDSVTQRQKTPWDTQKQHVEKMLKKGQYAAVIRDLEKLAAQTAPGARHVAEWAAQKLSSVRSEARSLNPRGLESLFRTATELFQKSDYQGCIQLIEDVPELRRTEPMEKLLEQALAAEAECEQLLNEIREKERRHDAGRLEQMVKRLLTLKPGNAYGKRMAATLASYSGVPATQRQLVFEGGRLKPLSSFSFLQQWGVTLVLAAIVIPLGIASLRVWLRGPVDAEQIAEAITPGPSPQEIPAATEWKTILPATAQSDWNFHDGQLSATCGEIPSACWTDTDYAQAEVAMEFFAEHGGSGGIIIRSASPEDSIAENADGLFVILNNLSFSCGSLKVRGAGSVYTKNPQAITLTPNAWNSLVLRVNGRTISVTINDIPAVTADLDEIATTHPSLRSVLASGSGRFGLICTAGNVRFRNIRINTLEEAEPPEPPSVPEQWLITTAERDGRFWSCLETEQDLGFEWSTDSFNLSKAGFESRQAPFGKVSSPFGSEFTPWTQKYLYLKTKFEVPSIDSNAEVIVRAIHSGATKVWVNEKPVDLFQPGQASSDLSGISKNYVEVQLPSAAKKLLKLGDNTIAVQVVASGPDRQFDFGIRLGPALSDSRRTGPGLTKIGGPRRTGWDAHREARQAEQRRDYRSAIRYYQEAIDLASDSAVFHNDFAWCLVTAAESNQRDGKRAAELATKACEITEWKNADFVATLAAALAEQHDFESAIQRAEAADELAKGRNPQIRKQLSGYRRQLSLADAAALPPEFVKISISDVATVNTLKRIFEGVSDDERLVLTEWKSREVANVPFQLIDPKNERKNMILLYSPQGTIPRNMPRSVRIPIPHHVRPITSIHLLSGVAGWGYPALSDEEIVMSIRLFYADGETENTDFRNRQDFADYRVIQNVGGSAFAFSMQGRQMRYLKVTPSRRQQIETIEFLKGPHGSAPLIMAATAEISPLEDFAAASVSQTLHLIHTAETRGHLWHISVRETPSGWQLAPENDPWDPELSGFGTWYANVRTTWNSPEVCLRTRIQVPPLDGRKLILRWANDDAAVVFVNGSLLTERKSYSGYTERTLDADDRSKFRFGDWNSIAVRCRQRGAESRGKDPRNPQFIDLGLRLSD